MLAPMAMPAMTYSQTRPTMSRTASQPACNRSSQPSDDPVSGAAADGIAYTQPSTWRSMCKRPITQPAMMAISNPMARYSPATFQPKRPNNSTSATSLTIGAEIRKENVTPSGTPAVTNPMNNGTAEQEQNGVTTPSSAANTLPTNSLRPDKIRRVRSAVKKVRTIPTPNTIAASSSRTLGVSKTKNSIAAPSRPPRLSPSNEYVSHRARGARLQ